MYKCGLASPTTFSRNCWLQEAALSISQAERLRHIWAVSLAGTIGHHQQLGHDRRHLCKVPRSGVRRSANQIPLSLFRTGLTSVVTFEFTDDAAYRTFQVPQLTSSMICWGTDCVSNDFALAPQRILLGCSLIGLAGLVAFARTSLEVNSLCQLHSRRFASTRATSSRFVSQGPVYYTTVLHLVIHYHALFETSQHSKKLSISHSRSVSILALP